MDGSAGDAVGAGDLAEAVAVPPISDDGSVVEFQRRPADGTTFEARAPHAGAHPLDDEVAFELGDGADDHDDGPAQ